MHLSKLNDTELTLIYPKFNYFGVQRSSGWDADFDKNNLTVL